MTGWKEGMNKVQKKSVKFCTWQKMLVCRASPRLMTRTSLQGLKLTCSLVIYRLRSFQFQGWTSMRKGGLSFFFFFRRLKKNMKVEEDIQWRFPRVTSARKPFVYRELCQSIEESKKRETRKGWLDMLSKLCELFQVLVFVENLDVGRKGF